MIPENNILQSLQLMFYILNLLRRHGIRNSLLFLPFEYSLISWPTKQFTILLFRVPQTKAGSIDLSLCNKIQIIAVK